MGNYVYSNCKKYIPIEPFPLKNFCKPPGDFVLRGKLSEQIRARYSEHNGNV